VIYRFSFAYLSIAQFSVGIGLASCSVPYSSSRAGINLNLNTIFTEKFHANMQVLYTCPLSRHSPAPACRNTPLGIILPSNTTVSVKQSVRSLFERLDHPPTILSMVFILAALETTILPIPFELMLIPLIFRATSARLAGCRRRCRCIQTAAGRQRLLDNFSGRLYSGTCTGGNAWRWFYGNFIGKICNCHVHGTKPTLRRPWIDGVFVW